MPIKSFDYTVDGHKVKVQQFLAGTGFPIKARLYKLALPVLSSVVGKGEGDEMSLSLNLPAAVAKLAEAIDPQTFLPLLRDLLSWTFVDDKELTEDNFNDIFAGNYFLCYKIVAKVIEANGFFAIGDIGSLLKGAAASMSPTK